jgi:hypothetical protein
LGIEINAIARKEHLGLLPVYTITALAVAIPVTAMEKVQGAILILLLTLPASITVKSLLKQPLPMAGTSISIFPNTYYYAMVARFPLPQVQPKREAMPVKSLLIHPSSLVSPMKIATLQPMDSQATGEKSISTLLASIF